MKNSEKEVQQALLSPSNEWLPSVGNVYSEFLRLDANLQLHERKTSCSTQNSMVSNEQSSLLLNNKRSLGDMHQSKTNSYETLRRLCETRHGLLKNRANFAAFCKQRS